MGPLTGLRVLELEAIGPAPFCGMLLADMGADVLLVDRPQRSAPRHRTASAGTTSCCAAAARSRSISSPRTGVDSRARARRESRRADRGLSSRRDRAPGARARRAARAQSSPRLRPHDRLGPGRSARAARGTRHRLHRAVRCAACDRPRGRRARCLRSTWSATSAAAACSSASASCAPCSRRSARAAARSSTRRWSRARRCSRRWCGACSRPDLERRARRQRARLRRTLVRHVRDPRRQALRGRRDRAQVLRASFSSDSGLPDEALPAQHDRTGWPTLRARFAAVFATRTRDEWSARSRIRMHASRPC